MTQKQILFNNTPIGQIQDYNTLLTLMENLIGKVDVFKSGKVLIYFEPIDDLLRSAWQKRIMALNDYKAGLIDDLILKRQFGKDIYSIKLTPMVYISEQDEIVESKSLESFILDTTGGQFGGDIGIFF